MSFEFLSTVVGVNLVRAKKLKYPLGVAGLPLQATVTSQKQGTGYDTNLTIGSGCVFSTECFPLMEQSSFNFCISIDIRIKIAKPIQGSETELHSWFIFPIHSKINCLLLL